MDDLKNIKSREYEFIKGAKMEEVNKPAKPELNLFNIKETVDGVIFLTSLGVAVSTSLKDDGKITGGDLPYFLEPVKNLPSFILGIEKIPTELKDQITEEELTEIITAIKNELPNDSSEELIADAVKLLIEAKNFTYKHFVNK